MAKPRDTLYTATVPINVIAVMASPDEASMLETLLDPINQAMQQVQEQMEKAGHSPSVIDLPVMTLIFEAKGCDYGDQDREGS